MLYPVLWIFRFVWFLGLLLTTYVFTPIVYVLFWIVGPLIMKFKVRSWYQIKQDIHHSDWQEVDTDCMAWDKHPHYPNPFDFLLKKNMKLKY